MVDVGKPDAGYNVEVGQPQIESPQYSVEVGQPQIEQSPAMLAMQKLAQSNDDNIRQHIESKLTRSPVLGHVTDSNLLSMYDLAKIGIGGTANAEGIPAGLDLSQLNPLEQKWLQKRTK